MNNFFRKSVVSLMALCTVLSTQAVKVHTIGDSTMQTYDENSTNTRGWAQYFQQFFTNGVIVNNRGKAGASSKSFYNESAYWASVKTQMQAGDYVLIQFSHNDEKTNGTDGDSLKAYYNSVGNSTAAAAVDYRGTTPYDTYKQYLRKYVSETREKGCTPVLVGPICRMYFSGNDIKRSGRHDLGDSYSVLTSDGLKEKQSLPASDNTMDYVWHMQQVAEEMNVQYIDLTTATADLFISYGDSKCHEILSDGDGSTHLSAVGATLIARLAASLLKNAGILADDIVIPADLSVSPAEGDFGEAYKGQTVTKEFTVNGFGLTPEAGTIAFSTEDDNLQLSVDKQTWSNNISVGYSGGSIVQRFFARMTLVNSGEQTASIKLVQGETAINIPVKVTSVNMEGGAEVSAYWRLEKDDSYVLTGAANVVPESWEGMFVQKYSSPNSAAVWPEWTGFDSSRKTQRNLIVGEKWPENEIDEVSTRYIQFGISPSPGTTLKIDSIGMFVCGAGGNGMRCHINYSTEPEFANQHTIFSPTKMVANNLYEVSAQPVVTLNEGDTLRLRVYPWYSSSAEGKTICLSDVMFHGKAFEVSTDGITSKNCADCMEDDSWYNIMGQKVLTLRKGIYAKKGKKFIIK